VSPLTDKLALLFAAAAVALNFPVLAIFNREGTLAGIPVLYVYLFGIWLIVIAAVWILSRRPWDGEE
jgi:hypothetical protein